MGNSSDKINSELAELGKTVGIEGLGEFGQLLYQQKTIRLFVDGPPGMGHQASSVTVLRALVASPNPPLLGLGYAGTVEVYYSMRPNGENTLQKLFLLLPELKNSKSGSLGEAKIKLIEVTKKPPSGVVTYGFAGGADDWKDDPDPNFIEMLNVKYFLRLQPYKWGSPLQIQRFGAEPIDLTTIPFLGEKSFADLAYFQLAAPPDEKVWDWFLKTFPDEQIRNPLRNTKMADRRQHQIQLRSAVDLWCAKRSLPDGARFS